MKYLKKYEKEKYNLGNLLEVKFNVWNTTKNKKEYFHTFFVPQRTIKQNNKIVYIGHLLDNNPNDTIYILEKDVVREISEEEARILINANKYNL